MRTQRTKIAIERGKQVSQENLQRELLLASEQSSIIGPPEKVPCLVKGTSGDSYEALVIERGGSAVAFGDVGSYTISSTDYLVTDGRAGKRFPVGCGLPNEVSQLFGHRIYFQAFEGELGHGDFS